ncbi:MAG: hypothetical protein IBX40_08955 [Methanosarcinales archaeon]|nr:hypothetical protein [Methanosarcinales archaeon]
MSVPNAEIVKVTANWRLMELNNNCIILNVVFGTADQLEGYGPTTIDDFSE